MPNHETYMQRCIELAQNGLGNVAPNPMVGAVIVYDGKIIGEGYHQAFGQAHAEVNAINAVSDKNLLKNSVLYVSLEPCSHHGKTPPCADLILHHQIPNVVIGCKDIFSKVNGAGVLKLESAGVNVTVGVLEDACKALNKRFFTFHAEKRPYVILKWAKSADGFIGKLSERIQISNHLSQTLVHKWRSEEQAIMVGTNTAIIDDPLLNVRLWKGKSPIRIALDRELSVPPHYHLLDNSMKTIIFNGIKSETINKTEYIKIDFSNNIIQQVLSELYRLDIQSVIVEGGAQLLNSFIDANLWDEMRVISSLVMIENGVKSPDVKGKLVHTENIGDNQLMVFEKH